MFFEFYVSCSSEKIWLWAVFYRGNGVARAYDFSGSIVAGGNLRHCRQNCKTKTSFEELLAIVYHSKIDLKYFCRPLSNE